MPQLNTLVVTDRESTPANHTFAPQDITNGVAQLVESTGVPIGQNTLSIWMRKTSDRRYKVTLKGHFPIVSNMVVNGVTTPTVTRTAYGEVTFSFDQTSTEQERKNAVGMLVSAMDPAKWTNDVLTKLQNVY